MSIVIAGGGLAGACIGALLARDGRKVKIFEGRPDCRNSNMYEGRSINLALSERGLAALRELGLEEEVKAICVPMHSRCMHDRKGRTTYQSYGQKGQVNWSVPRKRLNEILLDAAEAAGASVHFERRLADLDLKSATTPPTFATPDGARSTVECDAVLACDGAFSFARSRMQRTARFSLTMTCIDHAYKELTLPPAADGSFAIDPHALHIWPRDDYMLIALPNGDRSFTLTLFMPYGSEKRFGFRDLDSDGAVLRFFAEEFPDVVGMLPDLIEEWRRNPVGQLNYVRCSPWSFGDRVLLLGDACSAVVPFHGQGMNSALQQCLELYRTIKAHDGDIHAAIPVFASTMKPNADAISDLALHNYVEMRHLVNSGSFLLRARLELFLNRLFPGTFITRYQAVTFTETPYAECVRWSKKQDAILDVSIAVTAAAICFGAAYGAVRYLKR